MPYSPEDIKAIRKGLGLKQSEYAEMLGVSRYWVIQLEAGEKEPSELIIIKLNEAKSQLNLLSDKKQPINKNLIPLYDVDAIAGHEYAVDMAPVNTPHSMIDIGDFLRDSQCAIKIYGNSMTPNYPSGCIIGLRELKDGIIQYGHVYVIETEDNRYFKRLYKDDDKIGYSCHSDNTMLVTEGTRIGKPYYEPFVIPHDKIKRLFRVIGMIKRNEHSAIIGN